MFACAYGVLRNELDEPCAKDQLDGRGSGRESFFGCPMHDASGRRHQLEPANQPGGETPRRSVASREGHP